MAHYLIERKFIGPEAVVDGEIVITDLSSRNRNYRVVTREGPCYLLKQALTAEATATIAHEAAIYQRLAQAGDMLSAYVPRMYRYDATERILVLESLRDSEDLGSLYLRTGHFSAGPAATLGTALGVLHRLTEWPAGALAPMAAPPILLLHRPNAQVFRDLSAASLDLIRILQSTPGFAEALDQLRSTWCQKALIHGDVKWDNCLIVPRERDGEELRLIDWESAVPGDPCWDIGSALSRYLSCWLYSIPITGSEPPQRFPELAVHPLDAMKPALTSCWLAYAAARGLPEPDSSELLVRSVQMAGARLVQTGFEATQAMQRLTSQIVLHLQLAFNILSHPEEAATDLLGLPSRNPAT